MDVMSLATTRISCFSQQLTKTAQRMRERARWKEHDHNLTQPFKHDHNLTQPFKHDHNLTQPFKHDHKLTQSFKHDHNLTQPFKHDHNLTQPFKHDHNLTQPTCFKIRTTTSSTNTQLMLKFFFFNQTITNEKLKVAALVRNYIINTHINFTSKFVESINCINP